MRESVPQRCWAGLCRVCSKPQHIFIVIAVLLVLLSLAVAVALAITATRRQLTQLEAVLFQGVALIAGLLGSFIFGQQSTQRAARDLVKPHARSAFRRVLSLYKSLGRLAVIIEGAQKSERKAGGGGFTPYDMLRAVVVEQIATAGDALEDWRDIVPEEVDAIKKSLKTKHSTEESDFE